MSNKSTRKGRPTVARDPATYRPLVEQRLRLMDAAGARWETSGDDDEVITMALAARTLLGQDALLNKVVSTKRKMMFLDTAPPFTRDHDRPGVISVGFGGLTVMRLSSEDARVIPRCMMPSQATGHSRWVRFREWWTSDTPVRQDGVAVSREFLVYEVANTDGVHVSANLDAVYDRLTKGTAMMYGDKSAGSVVAAAMRQITWELSASVKRALEDLDRGNGQI